MCFSDTVTVDAIKYAELVAKKFSCGSDEAVLAYEIISYKYAVYEYVNEGAVEETVTALVDSFKEAYASHANGCTCTGGLYSDDVAINAPELDESEFENLDIYYISYILDSTDTGIFIEAEEVTMVTYKNLLGELVVHSEENGNLFYDDELCGYKITGITAADITSEFSIYVDDEFVTYTLAQYIANNSDVEVAKALYSYAMAAKAYKIAD